MRSLRTGPGLLLFFGLACGVSWLLWMPLWLPALGYSGLPVVPFHHALGALGPVSAAFTVTALDRGADGIRRLLSDMFAFRGRPVWIVVAVVGPFAIFALAVGAASLFAGEPLSVEGIGVSREFPQFSALGFFIYNVVSFGYGEETGWRGFALPHLQTRHSALGATVILTAGWALWHTPLFLYRPGYIGMGLAGVAGWFMSLLTGAILLTWLYNESRGSILVAALFHATIDIVFTSDVVSAFSVNASGLLITLWGLAVLWLAGPRSLATKGKVCRPERGPAA